MAKTVHIADNEGTKYNRLKIKLGRECLIDSFTEAESLPISSFLIFLVV